MHFFEKRLSNFMIPSASGDLPSGVESDACKWLYFIPSLALSYSHIKPTSKGYFSCVAVYS